MVKQITLGREGPLVERLKAALVSSKHILVDNDYVQVLSREILYENDKPVSRFTLEIVVAPPLSPDDYMVQVQD